MAEYMKCCRRDHDLHGSPYDRLAIPRKYFHSNEDDLTSKRSNRCKWCKIHASKITSQSRRVLTEKTNAVRKGGGEHFNCIDGYHTSASQYLRDRVPAEKFLSDPEDKNSSYLKTCSDCRTHRKRINDAKREACLEKGNPDIFFCGTCVKERNIKDRAFTKRGNPSNQCIKCQTVCNEWASLNKGKYRRALLNLKLEVIMKNECCCEVCKRIFLNGDSIEGLPTKSFETCIIGDNVRVIIFNGKGYKSSEFIRLNPGLLQLDILDFDHLPEEEQRARGILMEGDPYIPKSGLVRRFKTDRGLRTEATKCQLVCKECHIKETIRREKGVIWASTNERKRRLEIVNELKRKGCTICGYKNEDLLRFLEFDHKDPKEKTFGIARAIIRNDVTIEDIVKECAKCRVLCGHCHRVHTRNQIEAGIINFSKIIDDNETSDDSESEK